MLIWLLALPLTSVCRTVVASVLLALLLGLALCAGLSLGVDVLAAPAASHSLAAPLSTGELTATYLITGHITGQVRPVGGFPDMTSAVIYAGQQYSTTLDAAGLYTLTGIVSGTYVLRGELASQSPCVAYLFEPLTRTVHVPPNAAAQDFRLFQGHADPAPVQGTVTYSNGAPLPDVYMVGIGVTTGPDGWFASGEMLGCDAYTIMPQKLGFTFAPPSLTVTQPNVSGIRFIGTDHVQHQYLPIVAGAR